MAAPGVTKLIEVDGQYRVFTRRVGEGAIKVLLLHGGPGCTHEYFECFEDFLPQAGIEFYYYDQLGSFYSDQPDDPGLWTVDRFRNEVEQVRRALGLEDFYLYGQSWGGMLGIEYALHHQEHLRGLVISNMTASVDAYVKHARELRDALPADVVAAMRRFEAAEDYENPEYQQLLMTHLYNHHICRLPEWPDAVQRCMAHLAAPVYNTMQGPNEFVVTGNFASWNRWDDLRQIRVPTLLMVGRHDSMAVSDIEEMGRSIPGSRVAICEQGSHMAMWDDQATYFRELISFLKGVEALR